MGSKNNSNPEALIQICAGFLGRNCYKFDILNLISDFQWPQKSLEIFWQNLPVNHVVRFEENFEKGVVDFYWKSLVERCVEGNYVFKNRLNSSGDLFKPDVESKNEIQHHRQVLINSLFQEALDIGLYSNMGKDAGVPAFALHESLHKNAPNIEIIPWIKLLATKTLRVALHPRHATMILNCDEIINRLNQGCRRIDLILNSTLNSDALFQVYCKVVSGILRGSVVNALVICNLHSVDKSDWLFQVCFGGETQSMNKTKPPGSNVDVWDVALGESFDEEDDISSNEDGLYDDLVVTDETGHTVVPQSVTEIFLEYSTKLSLGTLLNVEKLKLTFVPGENLVDDALNKLEILVSNPSSNVSLIFLQNFEVKIHRIIKFFEGLCLSTLYRNQQVTELRFADCYIYDEGDDYNVESCSEITDTDLEYSLKHLFMDSVRFSCNKSLELFCQFVSDKLMPQELTVSRQCMNFESLTSVNLKLFTELHRVFPQKSLLKRCNIFIPKPFKTAESYIIKALESLSLETLTLSHEVGDKPSKDFLEIAKKLVRNFHIKNMNVVHEFSGNAIEDYVSQM